MTILTGDCRDLMLAHGPFDLILADPPYGDTSLAWDRRVNGWITRARDALRPTGSLWVFGSLRCFMATADCFAGSGAAGEACRLSGRRYLGCEIDAAMAERARARIAAVLPFHDGGAA